MKRIPLFLILGIIGVGLFFGEGLFPLATNAQLSVQEASQINQQDVSFSSEPEIPGAFQDVTVTVDSYLTDVSRAFFIWKKDGKTVLSATGANQFTFTTADIGQVTTIDVSMLLSTGEAIQKRMLFNPSEADLIWEGADSYTPPFYRGRALPSSEGYIRVVAIPQINNLGTTANINNFVFRWKRNDAAIPEYSGFNKSALVFQQSYLNEEEKIEVTSQENTTGSVGVGTVTVPIFKPQILMYARDAIKGVDWNHELGKSYDITSVEKTLVAIPYYFSPASPTSPQLRYTWTINGDTVTTPNAPNTLTLKSGSSKGISNLKVSIENTLKLFLEAEKNITINLK